MGSGSKRRGVDTGECRDYSIGMIEAVMCWCRWDEADGPLCGTLPFRVCGVFALPVLAGGKVCYIPGCGDVLQGRVGVSVFVDVAFSSTDNQTAREQITLQLYESAVSESELASPRGVGIVPNLPHQQPPL